MWGDVVQSHHSLSIMISTMVLFYHYIWLGKLENSKIKNWLSVCGWLAAYYLPPSLIALLIASVVAHCEESMLWLWRSEAAVMGTHQLGHSGGPTLQGPFAFFALDVHIKAGVLCISMSSV